MKRQNFTKQKYFPVAESGTLLGNEYLIPGIVEYIIVVFN